MMSSANSTQSPVLGTQRCRISHDSDDYIATKRRHRRRMSSDSVSGGEDAAVTSRIIAKSPTSAHHHVTEIHNDQPKQDDDTLQQRLEFLTEAFPQTDAMELQDVLCRHAWQLEPAVAELTKQHTDAACEPSVNNTRPSIEYNGGDDAANHLSDAPDAMNAPLGKRRRVRVCLSSSSDSDNAALKRSPHRAQPPPHNDNDTAASVKSRGVSGARAAGGLSVASACYMSDDEHDEDEFHQHKLVYFSESDSGSEDDDPRARCRASGDDVGRADSSLQPLRQRVVDFLSAGTVEELMCMSGCSRKKAEALIAGRPYNSWQQTVFKLRQIKGVNAQLLNAASDVVRMRAAFQRLLRQCEAIGGRLTARVSALVNDSDGMPSVDDPVNSDAITRQPANLNKNLTLSRYQLIGLSWLVLMYKENINAVLADEMGLGKTIQAIAFLAHLNLLDADWKYLVVVPSSILDNWLNELSVWCPSLSVLAYRGSLEQRRSLRFGIMQQQLEWRVIVTTYNFVSSTPEDKCLFRNVHFKYIVFDEAHMLKNMLSKRYLYLAKLKSEHRLLLTGTPLQNNLLELASLLVFVMPNVFANVRVSLHTIFDVIPKGSGESRSWYEQSRIDEARRIMAPFFLRRLKQHVLRDLPDKSESVRRVVMTNDQQRRYNQLSLDVAAARQNKGQTYGSVQSAIGAIMSLRKLANHPLLLRHHYTDAKLKEIAQRFVNIPGHEHKEVKLVLEDLSCMSDFEIHTTCDSFKQLHSHRLACSLLVDSGKMVVLDELLPSLAAEGHRVLMFSQFVIMLDVLECYLRIRRHRYCRLDGQTAVTDRQQLIDQYNNSDEIFVFLLSTRAGGLGINLTAADTVIMHDVDYNPQNDRQAEDRCHRIGQRRSVEVIKLVCKDTIDECMLQIAQDKLKLEQDISSTNTDKVGKDGDLADRPEDVRRLLEMTITSTKHSSVK